VQRLAAGLEPQGGSYSSESNREGWCLAMVVDSPSDSHQKVGSWNVCAWWWGGSRQALSASLGSLRRLATDDMCPPLGDLEATALGASWAVPGDLVAVEWCFFAGIVCVIYKALVMLQRLACWCSLIFVFLDYCWWIKSFKFPVFLGNNIIINEVYKLFKTVISGRREVLDPQPRLQRITTAWLISS